MKLIFKSFQRSRQIEQTIYISLLKSTSGDNQNIHLKQRFSDNNRDLISVNQVMFEAIQKCHT